MGSLQVGHDWVTSLSLFTFMHWRRKWQPAPVFLPGESLENPRDGGAWWAAVYGVAQSWTWLKRLSSSSSSSYYKAGKLDYSSNTTYQSVFNTTSCIWKKLVETKLQNSISSMKSLSSKRKRDKIAPVHFYRFILFSSCWTLCMLFGFITYKIRILILFISDC